ncbi:branched-chain amino acid ABC transporter substrate-binding protein [Nocardioides ginsengisoli]|uniref:Branched-chain amino acid ABC transporter substrate-binding protein n=1 Tax=Nocardioides ginsengisoli TaxID=363868 RepID=A0ABW3W8D1_9ACTN
MARLFKTQAVVGSALLALALAGCGDSGNGGSDKLNGGGEPIEVTSVKIGFQGPLSGDYQQLGLNEFNGVELAVKEANASKEFGFGVELVKGDDQGDPSKAPAAATSLIQDQGVLGVVGPAFSGSVKAAGAQYSSAGLAFVTPSATNAQLQDQGFSSFHRSVPSDNVEGTIGAEWLAQKAKKVFVIDDLGDYGKGVADALQKKLESEGVKVIREGVDAKTTDYSVVAQKVKASGAEALFYGGYDAQTALLAKAIKAVGYDGLKVTGNGSKSTIFFDQSGDAGNGWYFLCGCADAASDPKAQKFTDSYRSAYNQDPSTFTPESYDATRALLTAIKNAAADGSLTRKAVAKSLDEIDFQGIASHIRFDGKGDIDSSVAVVNLYEAEDKTFKFLGDVTKQTS